MPRSDYVAAARPARRWLDRACPERVRVDPLDHGPLPVLDPAFSRIGEVVDEIGWDRPHPGPTSASAMWRPAPSSGARGLCPAWVLPLFAISDRGSRRAFFNGLIVTAKLNDVDQQAWLADVLARIISHSTQRLGELPPWNWKSLPPASMP